ncbi:MAG: 30S ribosomal protein S26e [Candidatus Freyarchaeota archaeon]|nr:30S ribosomal protein S26e [Candidatus Freyrarchaeum guaymaensis]
MCTLPKKRKSRGRAKGSAGRKELIPCAFCGKLIPRDKAKKVTRYTTLVDPVIARELRKQGAYIPREKVVLHYCISCGIHRGLIKVRAEAERKSRR